MEADRTRLLNPSGLVFSSKLNVFYALEAPGLGQLSSTGTDLIKLTPFADQAGAARIAAAVRNPINTAYDNKVGRLLILQSSTNQLVEVRESSDGNLDPMAVSRYNVRHLGLQNPKGLSVDPATGSLFILDADGPRIILVKPASDGGFDGAEFSEIGLQSSSLINPRGIAFDPTSGHLHITDVATQKLYELALDGTEVTVRDLSEFDLKDPQGLLFAPSGDQTDDPAQMSLYATDSGVNDAQSTGQIVEFSLVAPAAAAASSFTVSLVKTIDMSGFTPPSPDPSGLTYVSGNNRLVVSDAEVEETVNNVTHFRGVNVWEMTLGGSVTRTANISKKAPTVVAMTNEPTGTAWNPSNGHFYFSDDSSGTNVFDLNPGADGWIGTSDDSWTGFDTNAVGNGDPEGIAYDTWNNRLFVADGVSAEVYQYTLTGTLVSHFDVQAYGVMDPEAVEFNPESGTLFVMSSNNSSLIMIETTISGALLQTINISATNARVPAGLAYAPASDGSGAMHFYIVDRGIDNNDNATIVDGKLYETTAPSAGTPATPSQTFTATSTFTPGPSPTSTPLSSSNPFFASFTANGSVGGVSFADEDILQFNGAAWSLFFDGSDVGVGSLDLFAFDLVDADTLLLSFNSAITIGNLAIAPQDIVRFDASSLGSVTAGTFSMYLDGSDVGLDTSGENLDSVSLLADGRVLISTTGDIAVPGVAGKDEDILAFTPTSLGDVTSGSWAMYFDGSDVGLADSSNEDVDALDVDPNGTIYLSTLGDFSVTGVSGFDEDVFVCSPNSLGSVTACNYSPTLYFDGSTWGLGGNDMDAFNIFALGTFPTITPTPTNTPTKTLTPANTLTATATLITSQTPTPTFTQGPANTPATTLTPTNTSPFTATPAVSMTPQITFTFTPTTTVVPSNQSLYLSLDAGGTVGSIAAQDLDILYFNGSTWSMFFDASDVGISSSYQDVNDFYIVDADTILMTFSDPTTLGTLPVDPWDIVQFDATSLGDVTAGTFSLYFDGNDVGFDTTAEYIDGLDVLADGRVLISTTGDPSVPGVAGNDEDILAFTPTSLGDVTSGSWAMYFDGSDVGLADSSNEDVNALDVVLNGEIYLSTTVDFTVTGISGFDEDVFACTPISLGEVTACNYSPLLYFDGSNWGLDANDVDGLALP
ncbi:MAG: hypothetical protein ABI621_09645 [Chloroflexota bacterium]